MRFLISCCVKQGLVVKPLQMSKDFFSKLIKTNFSIKSNIFANFLGNAVLTIASIVFVPIYLRYIGVEAYGLVGFFASFQAILLIMDLGLSLTLTRELALRDGIEDKAQESRNLVRTLEIIYWGIALSLGLLSILLVPVLTNWVNPQQLSPETIETCFFIMSIALILQFPIPFYQSGLVGLQKQVLSSVIIIFFSIFRYVGALAALHFISSKPQTFFIWQVISSGFQVLTLRICLWLILPKGTETTRFQKNLLTEIWKFITGTGGIGLVSVLLMQADKIVLVKILPLEKFGYYAIASVVANAIYRLVYPIFQAYLPKFSQLVKKGDYNLLARTYHQGCQVMAVVILPFSAMLILFSNEIVFLWQHNAVTASQTSLIISLLTIGYALNSLIFIPYSLQLANGWTKLYFYSLTVGLIISIPSITYFSFHFGAIGAAIVIIAVNFSLLLWLIPSMHRRLLPTEKWRWFGEDVLFPLNTVLIVGLLSRFLFINQTSQFFVMIQLIFIFLLIFLSACLVTSFPRNWIMNRLYSYKLK